MKTVQHRLSEHEIEDIRHLVSEATEVDGVYPVIRDDTWAVWIGAAKVHLLGLLKAAESAR